ncbi:MAG: hypothetical protein J6T54_10685 [Fibrobacter sp.]|nr:hypothetical protein [Fibrobacter sp.]
MKNFYKIAIVSCALAFTACDDSTSASDNGESTACNEAVKAECPATLEDGSICDNRDGKVYKITTVGSQVWMAENLNYYSCSIKDDSWCYDDKPENCDKYGRLYSWTAAMGIDKSYQTEYANLTGVQRGNCPEGFHMPSEAEWSDFYDFVANYAIEQSNDEGAVVRAKDAWPNESYYPATDDFGFAMLPAGEKSFTGFKDLGEKAFFWTADEDHRDVVGGPRNVGIWTVSSMFGFGGGSLMKDEGLSVRCIKD